MVYNATFNRLFTALLLVFNSAGGVPDIEHRTRLIIMSYWHTIQPKIMKSFAIVLILFPLAGIDFMIDFREN